jgi:hypothetical protein
VQLQNGANSIEICASFVETALKYARLQRPSRVAVESCGNLPLLALRRSREIAEQTSHGVR